MKLWLPEAVQWEILKTLHQPYHLVFDNTLVLVNKMFGVTKLKDIDKQDVQGYKMWQKTLGARAQKHGSYPREDWQLNFIHMPRRPKSKLQLLLVDTFPGCVEAFL
jgi:hypothetical protein